MYIPKQFEAPSEAMTLEVMRDYPFATIFSAGDTTAEPLASHVPVVTSSNDSVLDLKLNFHFARANPHAQRLRDYPAALVCFHGPHAYLSPSVYPDLKRVPTWNYIAVHVYGEARELITAEEKDALLKRLIAAHEPAYAQQWRDLDETYQAAMLNAITAFELSATRLESKFKLNQHRKESHETTRNLDREGDDNARALAQWMERLGL